MIADAQEWQRDLPCLAIAFAVHMAVLAGNPSLHWGSGGKPADAPVAVEFVTELPRPPAVTPRLASVRPGEGGKTQKDKGHGPGQFQAEKVKAGLPEAVGKVAPNSRPLAAAHRAKLARMQAVVREQVRQRTAELASRRVQSARLRAFDIAQARAAEAGRRAAIETDLRDGLASTPRAFPGGNPGFARDGRGGTDDVNSSPTGGGFEDARGGPVSWSVEGPVGHRRVLKHIVPHCPDWVSQRGLGLTVQLKFQVLEDGTVKRGIVIKRGSGFPDIDRLAAEALRRWKFQPIHSGVGLATPDVWGVISFKFLRG